tara:strand:+ start:190 stop:933 length:744 start_codon:yes stop_codon:yes gene_type:complete
MEQLKFSKGNSKLGEHIHTISLLSGWSCPFANDCLSKAHINEETGKKYLKDGKNTKFRCFSASQEVLYKNTYNQRKYNFDLVKKKSKDEIVSIIKDSLPKKATIIRIHVGGDFFNQKYFDAWLQVSKDIPNVLFYAYTKALPFWIARINDIPENFKLNASRGGKRDDLIEKHNLKEAVVVYSEKQAEDMNLEIDHDDTHAYKNSDSFALLIHGSQPKGSEASNALQELKKEGWTGYTKKGREKQTVK